MKFKGIIKETNVSAEISGFLLINSGILIDFEVLTNCLEVLDKSIEYYFLGILGYEFTLRSVCALLLIFLGFKFLVESPFSIYNQNLLNSLTSLDLLRFSIDVGLELWLGFFNILSGSRLGGFLHRLIKSLMHLGTCFLLL